MSMAMPTGILGTIEGWFLLLLGFLIFIIVVLAIRRVQRSNRANERYRRNYQQPYEHENQQGYPQEEKTYDGRGY